MIAKIMLCSVLMFMVTTLQPAHAQSSKTITVAGITFSWQFAGDRLHCVLEAPTQGWVALGFNTQSGLADTHLIMVAVKDGITVMDDLYIMGPGDPRSIEDLGGQMDLEDVQGHQVDGKTRVMFSIPASPADSWRKELREGNRYHVLLAYSTHDDFAHHSRIRRHPEVVL